LPNSSSGSGRRHIFNHAQFFQPRPLFVWHENKENTFFWTIFREILLCFHMESDFYVLESVLPKGIMKTHCGFGVFKTLNHENTFISTSYYVPILQHNHSVHNWLVFVMTLLFQKQLNMTDHYAIVCDDFEVLFLSSEIRLFINQCKI